MVRNYKLLVWGLSVIVAMSASPAAAFVLFIGDLDQTGDASNPLVAQADQDMIAHLQALGKNVLAIDDHAASTGNVANADFFVISSSASSGNVNGNVNGGSTAEILASGKPVLLMETGLSDEMGMNGGAAVGGTGLLDSITLIGSASPYTDGLGGPGSVQITNSPQAVGAFSVPGATGFGFPAFETVGTALTTDDGTPWGLAGFPLASYQFTTTGSSLIIGLPFNNAAFSDRTAAGEQLFDNAVMAAMAAVPEPSSLLLAGLGMLSLLFGRRRRDS